MNCITKCTDFSVFLVFEKEWRREKSTNDTAKEFFTFQFYFEHFYIRLTLFSLLTFDIYSVLSHKTIVNCIVQIHIRVINTK